ncbi:hypothetical protein ACHAWT_003897 [Skeletonema menzelii]
MSGKWRSRYAAQPEEGDEQTNSVMSSSGKFTTADVIAANQKLLNAISRCDYETYNDLCANDLTAFEPESNGMLISGKSFHKFYFDLYGGDQEDAATSASNNVTRSTTQTNITMSNPHVRWLGGGCCSDGCGDGSAAVISYVRMDQSVLDSSNDEKKKKGGPVTRLCSETRVWENRDGRLVHVHFHKS